MSFLKTFIQNLNLQHKKKKKKKKVLRIFNFLNSIETRIFLKAQESFLEIFSSLSIVVKML